MPHHTKPATVKIYHGYGHAANVIIYGHVLAGKALIRKKFHRNIVLNIAYLIRLFFVKPLPDRNLKLFFQDQTCETKSAGDGFFKFEFVPGDPLAAGWHTVKVDLLDENSNCESTGEGSFYVPHITQYAFISDIDDTVLISHSATKFKRLRVLFTRNPRTRKAFADVVSHYHLLSLAHTDEGTPNPFFYVSSSEWNLYEDLKEFFRHNKLPEGVFLLSEIKRWYQLFKTGKTKHEGKLIRVARILNAFKKQQFVLFGDNSQSDPEIYASIANKHPGSIVAIYIRNIQPLHEKKAQDWLDSIENKSINTFQFTSNTQAINHSRENGLI